MRKYAASYGDGGGNDDDDDGGDDDDDDDELEYRAIFMYVSICHIHKGHYHT